jgi:hypothetical protein
MWQVRSIRKAKKSNGCEDGDAGLRNTNVRWYGMIRVGGTGPKYRDGMVSKPAAGDISNVERRV